MCFVLFASHPDKGEPQKDTHIPQVGPPSVFVGEKQLPALEGPREKCSGLGPRAAHLPGQSTPHLPDPSVCLTPPENRNMSCDRFPLNREKMTNLSVANGRVSFQLPNNQGKLGGFETDGLWAYASNARLWQYPWLNRRALDNEPQLQ